jgi:hypothetical protein
MFKDNYGITTLTDKTLAHQIVKQKNKQ